MIYGKMKTNLLSCSIHFSSQSKFLCVIREPPSSNVQMHIFIKCLLKWRWSTSLLTLYETILQILDDRCSMRFGGFNYLLFSRRSVYPISVSFGHFLFTPADFKPSIFFLYLWCLFSISGCLQSGSFFVLYRNQLT